MQNFAQILLNHGYSRKEGPLTYTIPENMEVESGDLVEAPFQRRNLTGVVLSKSVEAPDFEVRSLLGVKEKKLLQAWQIQLLTWISEYYKCSPLDALKTMVPKRILEGKALRARKEKPSQSRADRFLKLSPEQEHIVQSILSKKSSCSLLHGITGSGKTEVYKALSHQLIEKGQQVLLLVPEIALTPQLTERFQSEWPDLVVIHSRIAEGQRAHAWRQIQEGKVPIVIGSRSALFAPFKNLGLIVMDEEHEWTYKQEQSPRYHARDVAFKIHELTGAHLLLGSATPSLESWQKALKNEIDYYELPERILKTPLPHMEIVDLREELRAGNRSIFSERLLTGIQKTLQNGEQVLLFLNRRGSASSTVCRDCGQAVGCPNCDVKMTFHRRKTEAGFLICHHCGRWASVPSTCPNCQSVRIRHFGIGTEKVEIELKEHFPVARIFRADADTMQGKKRFEEMHTALNNHEIDILLGTQMISKGFDLPRLTLVGVLLADLGLNFPDFRASERSFQLLVQVAGRAGRREKQGEVIVQTYNPEHPAIYLARSQNIQEFYEEELKERETHSLPPFTKLIQLIVVYPDAKEAEFRSAELFQALQTTNESMGASYLLSRAPALIPRLKRQFYWKILIQGQEPSTLLEKLAPHLLRNVRIDVDPMLTV